jgi:hypothetical protein
MWLRSEYTGDRCTTAPPGIGAVLVIGAAMGMDGAKALPGNRLHLLLKLSLKLSSAAS